MFLQIHTLVSYPASLLNRDDAGLAKRIPFGDATRLRVSSQCQKRHWRDEITQRLPDIPDGLRTTHFFTREVQPRLVKGGIPEDQAKALTRALAGALVKGGVADDGSMNQPVLFGLREADYFVALIEQTIATGTNTESAIKSLEERLKSKEEKSNLQAMGKSAGLAAALFGRMITSDLLARVDAPIHVAHAMTVHAARSELDYFTVVDDLAAESETGGAHLGQTELGAGVYYGYVVVDVPLLVSNLTGSAQKAWKDQDGALPRRVLDALVRTIASQSPGAKLGSTAPYAYADLVLLETGVRQPRTLANAFLEAVPTCDGNISQRAAEQMADYLKRVDGMYGSVADRGGCIATVLDAKAYAPLAPVSLDAAIECALDAIWG